MTRLRYPWPAFLLAILLLATAIAAAAQAPLQEEMPRHDAKLVAKQRFPVVAPGEPYTFGFTLTNSGTATWQGDGSYRLRSADGELPGIGSRVRLRRAVAPGEHVVYAFEAIAPQTPGLYRSYWQLEHQEAGEVFGPVVSALVVVAPARSLGGNVAVAGYLLRDYGRQAATALGQAADGLLRALEARLAREGQAPLAAEVACLQGLVAVGLVLSGPVWWRRRERDDDQA